VAPEVAPEVALEVETGAETEAEPEVDLLQQEQETRWKMREYGYGSQDVTPAN
jgi:hypothetical protein